jgi:hypothetical protein
MAGEVRQQWMRTLALAHHGSFQSAEGTTTLGEDGLGCDDLEASMLIRTQRALKLPCT